MKKNLAIVTLTYNQQNIIEKTIKCVLDLELFPDEIIIADDCSTDNTFEIIKKYENDLKSKISIVKIYTNKKNLGIYKNWENAIEKVNSNYITAMAGDDMLFSNSIYEIKSKLNEINLKNIILVYNYILVRGVNETLWNNFKLRNIDVLFSIIQNTLSHRNLCIPKEIWKKSVKQSELLLQNPDLNYGADLIKKVIYNDLVEKYIFIDKTLCYYKAGIGESSKNIRSRTQSESKTYNYLLKITNKRYHRYIKYRIFSCEFSLKPYRLDFFLKSIFTLFLARIENKGVEISKNLKYLIPVFIFNFVKKIAYN